MVIKVFSILCGDSLLERSLFEGERFKNIQYVTSLTASGKQIWNISVSFSFIGKVSEQINGNTLTGFLSHALDAIDKLSDWAWLLRGPFARHLGCKYFNDSQAITDTIDGVQLQKGMNGANNHLTFIVYKYT